MVTFLKNISNKKKFLFLFILIICLISINICNNQIERDSNIKIPNSKNSLNLAELYFKTQLEDLINFSKKFSHGKNFSSKQKK